MVHLIEKGSQNFSPNPLEDASVIVIFQIFESNFSDQRLIIIIIKIILIEFFISTINPVTGKVCW